MSALVPLFMLPGGPELFIIFFIAVLLFGSTKLPRLARAAGESMGEFQKGRVAVEQELDEMRIAARERADDDRETERTVD
jgi:sec-independent protein translocase protein TatA